MTQNELMHYGKKGMKWGTRHASAAKSVSDHARPGVDAVRSGSMAVTKTRASNRAKSEVPQMTNAELQAKIQRMNLEQQYQNLNANQISKGRANVDTTLQVAGSALAVASSVLGIALAVKQLKG